MSILSILVAFFVSGLLVWRLSRPETRLRILDVPNARSLHTTPVSRTGGIGIAAGAVAGLLTFMQFEGWDGAFLWILGGFAAVAAVSLADDWSPLSAGIRLGVHASAAAFSVAGGAVLMPLQLPGTELNLPPLPAAALSVIFIVWMTNLYNFMDGMDGFAGGMSVAGFGGLGMLGLSGGDPYFSTAAFAAAAAAAGFLPFNFPPARIFMGDVGAAGLGYLAGGLIVLGASRELFPFWAGVLVFGPFVADATVTLLRRLWRGEQVWEPHRCHYYQRLVTMGWGHRKTVLWEYGLMLISFTLALLAVRVSMLGQWLVLASAALIYILAMCWVDRRAPAKGPRKILL